MIKLLNNIPKQSSSKTFTNLFRLNFCLQNIAKEIYDGKTFYLYLLLDIFQT